MKRLLLLACLLPCDSALTDGPPSHGGALEIERWTQAAGGGHSAAAQFRVIGTAGQADASGSFGAGEFQMAGGFWPGFARTRDTLFIDGFEGQE